MHTSIKIKEVLTAAGFGAVLFLSVPVTVNALQGRLPVSDFTSQEELVSFPPTTTFPQALQILSQLATRFEGKVVIDLTNQSGPINIAVQPMHWRRALSAILTANGLEYVERATYYEVKKAEGIRLPEAAPEVVVIEGLTIDTREVEIHSIFFQADKRSIAEAGIDWSALISGDANVEVSSIGGSSVTQEFFSTTFDYTSTAGASTINTFAVLQAFEALNLGEIIATPSIKVLDGAKGFIQVGQSFSIKQRDFAGNTTDQFFEVGTIMTVTPQIITDKDVTFIHINVSAERSAAFPDPVSFRIDKSYADTDVLLLDGEQTVIAGLLSQERSKIRKGIPILKDLPWWFLGLRFLTGFSATDIAEKELIIFIRANLVPTLAERLERKAATLKQLKDRQRESFEKDKKEITQPN